MSEFRDQALQVLLLEDSRFDAELMREALRTHYPRAQMRVVNDEAGFVAGLRSDPVPQLVLSDYELPGFSGAQALELARTLAPGLPFIFVSGVIGEDNAVELLKRGATDYVSKSRLERLPVVVERALREVAERTRRDRAERQLRLAEGDLRERHALLSAVLASTDNLVFAKDREGRYILANDAMTRLIKRSAANLVGHTDEDIFDPALARMLRANDLEVQAAGHTLRFEETVDVNGQRHTYLATKTPLSIGGRVEGLVGVAVDITELKAAQAALADAVAAKETLLYELNHRVKNNLQVISSLLSLQAYSTEDPDAQAAISQARSRVSVVARLHQQLYQSGEHATLNYALYLRCLAYDTLSSLGAGGRIALDFSCQGEPALMLNQAVPLSLAVSELLTNAVKYAFPPQRPGRIRLALERDAQQLSVLVADDGVGLPPQPAPPAVASTGLGMRIVLALVQQLGGSLEQPPQAAGAAFRIVVPMP
jgi:PAS domain S-box-containing protein